MDLGILDFCLDHCNVNKFKNSVQFAQTCKLLIKVIQLLNSNFSTCLASKNSPTLSFVEKLKFSSFTSFTSFR